MELAEPKKALQDANDALRLSDNSFDDASALRAKLLARAGENQQSLVAWNQAIGHWPVPQWYMERAKVHRALSEDALAAQDEGTARSAGYREPDTADIRAISAIKASYQSTAPTTPARSPK